MRVIVAHLTANNQIKIKYSDRPECLGRKQQGDLSAQKEIEQIASMQSEVERINKILTHGCKEYGHTNSIPVHMCRDYQTKLSYGDVLYCDDDIPTVPVQFPACKLNEVYECYDENSLSIRKASYRELCNQKQVALDIISKNQQAKKAERCWGKPQTLKRFTSNAKQKILEAGAVVDRDCGQESSFELTLTIPGSGYEVYRVVSEWSGWIVNRQTQIIRRLEAKGWNIYWFYVWEHQKRGALHQHWCISIPGKPAQAYFLAKLLRKKWFQLLEELTIKVGVDLFQRRGGFGTWRYTPEVWQTSISQVRKSVAAYFSKYASKNADTSKYNENRRKYEKGVSKESLRKSRERQVYTLCPSRYWGCGSRVKRRCHELAVLVCFEVFSRKEGDFIYKSLKDWVGQICSEVSEVSRYFEVACPRTNFIYCSGWENRLYFERDAYDAVWRLFSRIKNHPLRQVDAIGAIADLLDF